MDSRLIFLHLVRIVQGSCLIASLASGLRHLALINWKLAIITIVYSDFPEFKVAWVMSERKDGSNLVAV